MLIGGCCYSPPDSPSDGPLTATALKLLRNVFWHGATDDDLPPLSRRPMLRVTASLATMFPSATATNFDYVGALHEVALATGWRIYFDTADWPAWATGGIPAYVQGIGGSSCQVLAQWGVPREVWQACYDAMPPFGSVPLNPDTPSPVARVEAIIRASASLSVQGGVEVPPAQLTNTPDKIAWHFADDYGREQRQTWARDVPWLGRGEHVWGDPKFADVDKFAAPRPWLLSADAMPHADPKASRYLGEVIGEHFGDDVDLFGVGVNEPDIALFNPLIRFDGVNGGGGGNTIGDRLIPEMLQPFVTGLRAALTRRAALTAVRSMPSIAGPNVAYPGTLPRFGGTFVIGSNVYAVHTYADGTLAGSYAHAQEYAAQAAARGMLWGISEYDRANDDAGGTVGWLRGLVDLGLDPALLFVTFLDATRFIDGFHDQQGKSEINATGRDMQKLFGEINGKRRAVRG